MIDLYGKEVCMIHQQDNSFCDKATFKHWVEKCFVPHLIHLREVHNYKWINLLILDGYFSHLSLDLVDYLNNVALKLLPAHTSHYLQPLDVFGAIKNVEVGVCNISKDEAVNDIDIILNKIQKHSHITI